MRPFCRKNHVHKFLVLGGGGYFGLGGGSADFIFMGARIFLNFREPEICVRLRLRAFVCVNSFAFVQTSFDYTLFCGTQKSTVSHLGAL